MFKFKDITNKAMSILPIEENFHTRATKRYNEIQVEGRDGSIFEETGYNNVVSSLELQVLDINRRDEILEWLSGSGDLEYNGRIAKIAIYDEVSIVRSESIYMAIVNYIRSPFWYTAKDQYIVAKDNIHNLGNVYSEPLLLIKGKAGEKADITIGNIRFQYAFDSDEVVEIDCEEKTEYFNGKSKSKNIMIGFQYPKLYPGPNPVVVHSGNVEIKVKRKDRWL